MLARHGSKVRQSPSLFKYRAIRFLTGFYNGHSHSDFSKDTDVGHGVHALHTDTHRQTDAHTQNSSEKQSSNGQMIYRENEEGELLQK